MESGLVTPMTSKPFARAVRASADLRAAASFTAFPAAGKQDRCSALEIEIGVGFRRRDPGQGFGEQWPKRRSRLHPRIPDFGVLVLAPWYIAQIVGSRQMCGGSKIGIAHPLAGEPVAGAHQPADIRQVVSHVVTRNA